MSFRPADHDCDLERRFVRACRWAKPFLAVPFPEMQPGFGAMRRNACLERLCAGRSAWRNWAATMTELLAIGRSTPLAGAIAAAAVCDFTGVGFDTVVDLAGCHFPSHALFRHARFQRDAYFNGCTFTGIADFRQTALADAWFESANFLREAEFAETTWVRQAEFRNTRFVSGANFAEARFDQDIWARGSVFEADACFAGGQFNGEAGFGTCQFLGITSFARSVFTGNAGFDSVRFGNTVSFEKALFKRKAWFAKSSFAGAAKFDLARFQCGADVTDTQFSAKASNIDLNFL